MNNEDYIQTYDDEVRDEYAAGDSNSEYDTGYIDAATSCAAAIRARSDK